MKYLFVFVGIMIGNIVFAQVTPKAVRVEIKTPNATCDPCKAKIESWVPKSVDGLVKISVQISRGVTTVQYYPDRTNIEELKAAISNAGFDADDVQANPDTYKKLPACCKKPEDRIVE